VLKDFSLSFWDVSDNYSFEKSISTTKYCQDLQVNIWYL
jgi:WD40 repeat protein